MNQEKRERISSFWQEYGSLLILAMAIVSLGIAVTVIMTTNTDAFTVVLPSHTSMPPISTDDCIDQAILYPLPDTSNIVISTETMPPTGTITSVPPTATPTSTLTVTSTPTSEPVVCQDDLAEVQAALSSQWSLLDPHSDPGRIYYSGTSRFVIPLVSSGNFYVQSGQLADGSEVLIDIVTAYSVDDDNNLYALDVAVGAHYADGTYTLFINRWSPFEAQITNLDEAKEMLARGRLFSVIIAEFVSQADTIIWEKCLKANGYTEFFSETACELGRIVEESQPPDSVTTLVRGDSPPEGENVLLAGWVIHIPNEKTGAAEYGYMDMPDCK